MSNILIIMKKLKCDDDQKQRVIKISEMLKMPLNTLKVEKGTKSLFNSGNSYYSMFLQPIDQQYSHNQEEHLEIPNLPRRFDVLNYSTDSSDEFPKKEEFKSKNLHDFNSKDDIPTKKSISLVMKNNFTSINQFLRLPTNTDNISSYIKSVKTASLQNDLITKNKIPNNQNKNKLTKLLKPGWSNKIALDKNKSLHKLLLHMRTFSKFMSLKLNCNNLNQMSTQNIRAQSNKNITVHKTNENHLNSKTTHLRNIYLTNDYPNNPIDEYNFNKIYRCNKVIKQEINNKINFTCSNNINHFPINDACEYKHGLKQEFNLINKIKYRRPLSVD